MQPPKKWLLRFYIASTVVLWSALLVYIVPRIPGAILARIVDGPFEAAASGRADLLEIWLAAGGDPNAIEGPGETLLQYATLRDWLWGPDYNDQFDTVALLLSYGADPNGGYDYDSALMGAAENSNYATFVLLLAAGADPHFEVSPGETIQALLESKNVPDRKEKLRYLNAVLKRKGELLESSVEPAKTGEPVETGK